MHCLACRAYSLEQVYLGDKDPLVKWEIPDQPDQAGRLEPRARWERLDLWAQLVRVAQWDVAGFRALQDNAARQVILLLYKYHHL